MDKFNFLVDSSYNLLEASKKNEESVELAIKSLNKNIRVLNESVKSLDREIADKVKRSSEKYAEIISKEVISKLDNANESAEKATAKYEKAAKLSIFKLGTMFFLFFIMAGALLWFFFIKEIPTINEINSLKAEKTSLKKDIVKLKKYGDLASCGNDEKLCIKVDISTSYGKGEPYYLISPKY